MSTKRFSVLRFSSALALAAVLGSSPFVAAQEARAPQLRKPRRPAAQELKAPASACVPACRTGYACVEGECVSKCNPGCGAGERCNDAGECELTTSSSKPAAPSRRGAKPPRAAKPAAAEQGDGNNWGVPPPPEPAGQYEPAAESNNQGATVAVEAEVKVEGRAEGAVETKAPAAPPPVAPHSNVRNHDGFYLRLGLGSGAFSGSMKLGPGEIDLSGFGLASEFALGGTVARGLVVGGGSYQTFVPTTNFKARVDGEELENDGEATTSVVVGPFIDYYPNPAGGLHFQGALGVHNVSLESPTGISSSGSGVGLMLGVGHEWWVGEQWSIGVLGRLTAASHTIEDDNGTEWKSSFATFGVLGTFTYH